LARAGGSAILETGEAMRRTMTFLGLCAAGALFAQVMLLPPADIERALFDSINKERAARSSSG